MDDGPEIRVSVAYASENLQKLIELDVPVGARVLDAITASEMASFFPDVDFEAAAKGIFGVRCDNDRVLEAGDRVEIYRPLITDAKEARRKRAKKV